jgi:hypothetical protein
MKAMLIKIYKLLLHSYPDGHRAKFGQEMVSVLEQAQEETVGRGAVYRATFVIRELSALILDAFRAQMESASSSSEPWIWSLEAPIAAIVLYAFWVWRSEEMGMHGFFFPGTYLVVVVLGSLSAWLIGRECAVIQRWHRWRRAAIVFSISALAVPLAARTVESAWASYALTHDAGFAFHLPGIQVAATDDLPNLEQKGLTFSRILTHSDGRSMTLLQHTTKDTPPYLFLGAIAVGALAFRSRRTALA